MSEPFSAKQKCLEELMRAGRHAYAIPLYQRRYVWNAEENRTLWEDVINCYLSRSNHFLGSFVLMDYVRDDYDQKYQADVLVDETYTVRHVVDGQQRMTSLSILLAALYRDMVENDSYFSTLPGKDNQDEQDWDTLKAKMRDCLITDVRDRESKSHKGYIPRLIPGKSVYEEYKRMANLEGLGKPRLLIEKAYDLHLQSIKRFRHEQIPEMGEGAEERSSVSASRLYSFYNQMYLSIANRIKIIRIICSAEEDAFQVFESLNGTGIRLTSADRIKNMLMGKGSKERDPVPASAIEADWQELAQLVGSNSNIESFLRAFLFTVKGQRVSRTELAKVFTNDYLPEFASVRDALSRLKHAAVLFGAIVNQSEYISKNGERKPLSNDTKQLLRDICSINPAQSVVPLLAAAEQYGFEDARFTDIAKRLLVLLVRHKVCQKSTNALDIYFEEFCKAINGMTAEDGINALLKRQASDVAFESSFASLVFNVEKRSEVVRARYYLRCIENYLRNKSGDCNLDSSEEFTLEHIIPQTFNPEKWFAEQPSAAASFQGEDADRELDRFKETIGSIGNMCLLRRSENSSASNSSFDDKLIAYQSPDSSGKTADDTFCLVHQIVQMQMEDTDETIPLIESGQTFDSTSVEKRARVLAHYALKIWV